MNFGSVCSGIEAASVAWRPLGWRCAFVSEIEPFPCAVLAHHYPDVPNYGDMTKFKEWPDANIDVLVGGTPCQSFSVAGLRKGLADPRGNLTLTYLAVADRYRPRWLVWENVPGILSDRTGAFGAFLGGLGELGYGFAYRILDAQYCGVPQRRRRVFVVGCLGDWRSAAAVLFERHSLQGHSAPRREAGKGLAPGAARSVAIRGRDGIPQAELGDDKANAILTPNGGRGGVGVGAIIAPDVARCIATCEGTSQDWETTTMVAHSLRADGFDASEHGTGRGTPIIPILEVGKGSSSRGVGPNGCGIGSDGDPMYTLQRGAQHAVAFDCKAGANTGFAIGDVSGALRGAGHGGGHAAIAFQSSQSGVREVEAHATLDGNNGSRRHNGVMHAMRVRRLTPEECEKLQGFLPGYTAITRHKKPAADGPRYKALGNSMAVPCMRWIGERIAMVHEIAEAA